MSLCQVTNCGKNAISLGYCNKHYTRFKRHGDPEAKFIPEVRICSIDGCGGKHIGRGYCSYHYGIFIRYGRNTICRVQDCGKVIVAHGLCTVHYQRSKRGGDIETTLVNTTHPEKCTIEGCDKPYEAKGMCHNHYMNWYNEKNRKIVIEKYTNHTNKCQCCGESIYEFLTIDHPNNNGYEDRKNGLVGERLVNYLIKNNFPEGFQIMCYNCNCGRSRNGGICPHKNLNTLKLLQ